MKEQLIELAKEKKYYSFHTINKEVGNGWYIELCLLQKWLREIHNIEIFVTYWSEKINKEFGHNSYEVLVYDKKVENEYIYSEYFSIYEEALEDGLHQALKLI